MEFKHTLQLVSKKGLLSLKVELDVDSELNFKEPIPNCKENKIEPIDGSEIFYTNTFLEISQSNYYSAIMLTPLN